MLNSCIEFLHFGSADDSPCLNEVFHCFTGDLHVTSPCCDLDIRDWLQATSNRIFLEYTRGSPNILQKHIDEFRKNPRNCGQNWAESRSELLAIKCVHIKL